MKWVKIQFIWEKIIGLDSTCVKFLPFSWQKNVWKYENLATFSYTQIFSKSWKVVLLNLDLPFSIHKSFTPTILYCISWQNISQQDVWKSKSANLGSYCKSWLISYQLLSQIFPFISIKLSRVNTLF